MLKNFSNEMTRNSWPWPKGPIYVHISVPLHTAAAQRPWIAEWKKKPHKVNSSKLKPRMLQLSKRVANRGKFTYLQALAVQRRAVELPPGLREMSKWKVWISQHGSWEWGSERAGSGLQHFPFCSPVFWLEHKDSIPLQKLFLFLKYTVLN